MEEKIQQAKEQEELCQEEVKEYEEELRRLSDQQDEGTMECSERIV